MTIGEMKNFLSNPDNWQQLGWNLPQAIIVDWIGVLSQLRNEVAHFHNDAEEITPRLNQVRNLTNWLRSL